LEAGSGRTNGAEAAAARARGGVTVGGALLLIACAAGVAARFLGLTWGLPFELHPDEPVVLGLIEQMSWRDLNPRFFVYPGLFLYQLFGLGRMVFAFGGEYLDLLLAARFLAAIHSVATVLFVYLLGARLGGRRLGLIAAALVALTGALVLHAHYATTDTPATALATATLWLAVRARQRGSYAELLGATAVAGLATSTKYSVALVALVPWLACMVLAARDRLPLGRRAVWSAAVAGAALAAFLATSPYTVLDHRGFLRDLQTEALRQAESRAGEHDDTLIDPTLQDRGLVGNAVVSFRDLGAGALALALAAMVLTLAGRPVCRDRVGLLLVITWPLLYFSCMAPSAKFGQRYALPMYPALMLLAAAPIATALGRGGRARSLPATPRSAGSRPAASRPAASRPAASRPAASTSAVLLATAGFVVAVTAPTLATVEVARLLAQRDTRLEARDWILANLRPGARLAREFYAPPLRERDGFRLMQPFSLTDHSLETYCRDGVDYLLLSSLNARRYLASDEQRFAEERAWYDRLEQNTRLVHRVAGRGNLERHHPTIEVRSLYCGTNR
jgi:hypothetical protein